MKLILGMMFVKQFITEGDLKYENKEEGSDWEKCLNVGSFQSPIDI